MQDRDECIGVIRKEGASRVVQATVTLIEHHLLEAMKALKTANADTFRKYQGQIAVLERLKKEIVGDDALAPLGNGGYGG